MKKNRLFAATALLLAICLLCGCAPAAETTQETTEPKETYGCCDGAVAAQGYMHFALSLLKQCNGEGENTLLSPLSVYYALAMTANGASGNTQAEMSDLLGMGIEDLSPVLETYLASQTEQLHIANSIWFTDDKSFTVEQGFLDAAKQYFDAELFRTDFSGATADQINNWVKDNTDGMIEQIVKEVPEDAVMYLVNALAFEAEWAVKYNEHQVKDGTFTAESGAERQVSMMHSTEHAYLDDGSATGFIKYYNGRKYAFAALLPNEGVSMEQYLDALTPEKLANTLANPEDIQVFAAIPKFETEYSVELSDTLKAMGMTDAFDMGMADFSRLGSSEKGNIYISRVQHKTFFSIGEQGTRAGAATLVEMAFGAALMPEETRTVTLDRPFVYMLIDCETNLPFFIGTMLDVEG